MHSHSHCQRFNTTETFKNPNCFVSPVKWLSLEQVIHPTLLFSVCCFLKLHLMILAVAGYTISYTPPNSAPPPSHGTPPSTCSTKVLGTYSETRGASPISYAQTPHSSGHSYRDRVRSSQPPNQPRSILLPRTLHLSNDAQALPRGPDIQSWQILLGVWTYGSSSRD